MNIADRKLLIREVTSRLPYGVRARIDLINGDNQHKDGIYDGEITSIDCSSGWVEYNYYENPDWIREWSGSIENIKLYLRPLSSMTDDELDELIFYLNDESTGREITRENFQKTDFGVLWFCNMRQYECVSHILMDTVIDFLLEHHFDFRGLIKRGFAIEASKDIFS